METLRNGHEAYGLTEKRLGEIYKCKVRAMDYPSKIKALEQRSSYFEKWQNEVAERLPGKKTASMEKYGTPRTKTMENTRISWEGKRSIEGLLREHGLESRLNEFQFTSVTTLRTEGMFGVYNRDQVVPSALEFKYLSSRSALECAMESFMGLGFKRKRETRYEHRDDCQMLLLYTKRKDDCSFIKESSRVKKEASEMRDFCRVYGKGVKVSGVRQIYKQRPGSLPLYCRKAKSHGDIARWRKCSFVAVVIFCDKTKWRQKSWKGERQRTRCVYWAIIRSQWDKCDGGWSLSNQRRRRVPSEGHTRAWQCRNVDPKRKCPCPSANLVNK